MTRAILLFVALAACKSAGMGADTRADIQAQMRLAEPALQACYAEALKDNRKLKGRLSLRLTAEASSGQFKNISVLRDGVGSTVVRQCAVDEIGKLKLSKPTSSQVQIDQPLNFQPNN